MMTENCSIVLTHTDQLESPGSNSQYEGGYAHLENPLL